MLSKIYLNQIRVFLNNNSLFSEHDFQIDTSGFEEDGMCALLGITYRWNPDYGLSLLETEDGSSFVLELCPGRVRLDEQLRLDSLDGLDSHIKEWVRRLIAELTADPISAAVVELGDNLEEVIRQLNQLDDSIATTSEQEELRTRLDEIEAEFREHLTSSKENESDLKEELESLRKDFDLLKQSVSKLGKSNWAKSAIFRIGIWAAKTSSTPVLARLGAELADRLASRRLIESKPIDSPQLDKPTEQAQELP